MARLLDEFVAVTEQMNRRGIEFAVCGGWAMAIHGFLRATVDIDILILTEDLDAAMATARECGFEIEGLPMDFDGGKTRIRRISKIDADSGEIITLDMILVTETLQSSWERRKRVKWNHGEYQVVSVKGMIKMKELAGRPKDLIDLEFLRSIEDDEDGEDGEN